MHTPIASSSISAFTFAFIIFFIPIPPILAQSSISATPDEFVVIHLDDFPVSILMSSEITNSSQDTIAVGWQRMTDADCPVEWFSAVGDRNITYAPFISESPQPIFLDPQETDEPIDLTLYPMDAPGCCNLYLILRSYDDPSDVFDTITYRIILDDPSCLTTAVTDIYETLGRVEILPNPLRDIFTITGTIAYDQIRVYNALGEHVPDFGNGTKQFDASGLADGIYVVQVIRKNAVVGVGKMVKL